MHAAKQGACGTAARAFVINCSRIASTRPNKPLWRSRYEVEPLSGRHVALEQGAPRCRRRTANRDRRGAEREERLRRMPAAAAASAWPDRDPAHRVYRTPLRRSGDPVARRHCRACRSAEPASRAMRRGWAAKPFLADDRRAIRDHARRTPVLVTAPFDGPAASPRVPVPTGEQAGTAGRRPGPADRRRPIN